MNTLNLFFKTKTARKVNFANGSGAYANQRYHKYERKGCTKNAKKTLDGAIITGFPTLRYQAAGNHALNFRNVANNVVNNGHLFVDYRAGVEAVTPPNIFICAYGKYAGMSSKSVNGFHDALPVLQSSRRIHQFICDVIKQIVNIRFSARRYKNFIFDTIHNRFIKACRNAIFLFRSSACVRHLHFGESLRRNGQSIACPTCPSKPQRLSRQAVLSPHILIQGMSFEHPYQKLFFWQK